LKFWCFIRPHFDGAKVKIIVIHLTSSRATEEVCDLIVGRPWLLALGLTPALREHKVFGNEIDVGSLGAAKCTPMLRLGGAGREKVDTLFNVSKLFAYLLTIRVIFSLKDYCHVLLFD